MHKASADRGANGFVCFWAGLLLLGQQQHLLAQPLHDGFVVGDRRRGRVTDEARKPLRIGRLLQHLRGGQAAAPRRMTTALGPSGGSKMARRRLSRSAHGSMAMAPKGR